MIKVIEEHHDNETVTIYRGKCGHCGSVVEFTQDECSYIEYLGMAITCPVCRLRNISIKNAESRVVKVTREEMDALIKAEKGGEK